MGVGQARFGGYLGRGELLLPSGVLPRLQALDTGVSPPELVSVVEGPGKLEPGKALDLGCGTGTNSIYLARHGWETTGVDFVPRAIAQARRKAAAAGASPRFLVGDVTRLTDLGMGYCPL